MFSTRVYVCTCENGRKDDGNDSSERCVFDGRVTIASSSSSRPPSDKKSKKTKNDRAVRPSSGQCEHAPRREMSPIPRVLQWVVCCEKNEYVRLAAIRV